jgi:hypothetical protein
MSQPKRIVRVNPNTLHRELQGEGVLLQLDTGEYFGLDEMAERMWTLMMEHGDLALVEARLLAEFEVEPEVLSRDLGSLVDELVQRQLVNVAIDPDARPSS